MTRLFLTALLLLVGTGCLEVDRIVYTFDAKTLTGEILYVGIHSDSADNVDEDYKELMDEFVNGNKLESENPGFNIQSKELFEQDGKLVGRVRLGFRNLEKVGIYQHDKKSPYIYCDSDDKLVLTTNGTQVQDVLKGCVVWDRKVRTFEMALGDSSGVSDDAVSLLDRWKVEQKR